jgi:hypothetical protein
MKREDTRYYYKDIKPYNYDAKKIKLRKEKSLHGAALLVRKCKDFSYGASYVFTFPENKYYKKILDLVVFNKK